MESASCLTSRGFLPPLTPSSSKKSSNNQLNDFVSNLFKAALQSDKKTSQELLKDPTFGKKIVEKFPDQNIKTKRIVLLNILARDHIGNFQKQEIANLICALGESNYVASCIEEDVEALYKKLFSYPQCQSFSQEDLLYFEHDTTPDLQPYVFKRILNHCSFADLSTVAINNLARRYLGYLPKPHIQRLVYTIGEADSSTQAKVEALRSSVFSYRESDFFSKAELMDLAMRAIPELRPYILQWAILHQSFLKDGASLEELNRLTEKFEQAVDEIYPSTTEFENPTARIFKIQFLSSLTRHQSDKADKEESDLSGI